MAAERVLGRERAAAAVGDEARIGPGFHVESRDAMDGDDDDGEDEVGIAGGQQVVEHHAQPALHARLELPDGKRLPDVEEPEEREGERLQPEASGGERGQRQEGDDLVPDERAVVLDAEVAARHAAGPDAHEEERHGEEGDGERRQRQREEPVEPQAASVPAVPGARGASPAPKPRAMKCAGCARRNRASGRREVVESAAVDRDRLAVGAHQETPLPLRISPMRVSGTPSMSVRSSMLSRALVGAVKHSS